MKRELTLLTSSEEEQVQVILVEEVIPAVTVERATSLVRMTPLSEEME